jgi:valyl-tRNA synthetase
MMTYISEELYQKLPEWQGKSKSICIADYPVSNSQHIFAESDSFNSTIEIISDIRKIIGTINLPPKSNPPVFISVQDNDAAGVDLIKSFGTFIAALSKVGEIQISNAAPNGCISVLSAKIFTVNVEVIKFIKVEDEVTLRLTVDQEDPKDDRREAEIIGRPRQKEPGQRLPEQGAGRCEKGERREDGVAEG